MKTHEVLLSAAIILSALMSGFFFAYSFSVNLGLHKLDNKAYLQAMQNINKEVLNPVFYSCFCGALLLLITCSVIYFDLHSTKFYLLLCACVSYTIGVFIITGTRNVPLNNQLAVFDNITASEASLKNMRETFQSPWVFWNNIRTLSSFITLICLIISVVFFGSSSKT